MSRLYLRGNVWWLQAYGRRVSTGCVDKVSAQLWAATHERMHVVITALKTDPLLREAVETYLADAQRAKCKGFIYALKAGAEVKLGFTSKSPARRIRQLQTGQALPLELVALVPGTRLDERQLHARLRAARIRGEWFDANHPDVKAWVSVHEYTSRTPNFVLEPKAA